MKIRHLSKYLQAHKVYVTVCTRIHSHIASEHTWYIAVCDVCGTISDDVLAPHELNEYQTNEHRLDLMKDYYRACDMIKYGKVMKAI